MPTPSQDLYDSLLNGGASPLALAIENRLYPVRLPGGAPSLPHDRMPCVVFRRVFTKAEAESQDGWGGLMKLRWQFDCWALTHYEAEALADTLRASLVAAPVAAQQVSVMDADAGADESLYRVIVEAYTWLDEEA